MFRQSRTEFYPNFSVLVITRGTPCIASFPSLPTRLLKISLLFATD